MSEGNTTGQLQLLLDKLKAGDDSAREKLLEHACKRLEVLAHRMLRHYPSLQRWEQTGDVLQAASLRLYQSLQAVKPDTVGQFFGLATTQIRRQLIDLCRKHFGPEGAAAHHATKPREVAAGDTKEVDYEQPDQQGEPRSIEDWSAFHEQVDSLPEEERQVVDLLFYQDLTQAEAASLLGISVRTVKRQWQKARMRLQEALKHLSPNQ